MDEVRISCRLEVLPGATLREQAAHAAAFGFDGLALPGRTLVRYLKELRGCRREIPLPLVSLSLGFPGSLVSPQAAVRERCRDSLLRLFALCEELAIGLFNMPPVLIQDNPERMAGTPAASAEAAQDRLLLEQLPALADAAAARGVVLLLEPVNRYESEYLNTLSHAARLCDRLSHPALACTADFFHMQLEELSTPAALRDARRWVRHVHVAENTRVEPGPGSLDFLPGFRALRESGYSGWLEVECRALSGPPEAVLPHSARYLRETWHRAGASASGAAPG